MRIPFGSRGARDRADAPGMEIVQPLVGSRAAVRVGGGNEHRGQLQGRGLARHVAVVEVTAPVDGCAVAINPQYVAPTPEAGIEQAVPCRKPLMCDGNYNGCTNLRRDILALQPSVPLDSVLTRHAIAGLGGAPGEQFGNFLGAESRIFTAQNPKLALAPPDGVVFALHAHCSACFAAGLPSSVSAKWTSAAASTRA